MNGRQALMFLGCATTSLNAARDKLAGDRETSTRIAATIAELDELYKSLLDKMNSKKG